MKKFNKKSYKYTVGPCFFKIEKMANLTLAETLFYFLRKKKIVS